MTGPSETTKSLSRRSFVLKTAASGAAVACGADLIGGLASAHAAPRAAASSVSVTLNDMPAQSDKVNLASFHATVARFEAAHPDIKVIGKTDTFDPTTFYAHYAVGNVEDSYKVYFTDVQHLIQIGYARDISAWMKNWKWTSSIQPSVRQLISDASGKIYGFPVDAYALGLSYSKRYFKAAGLDPNSPPTTWDQFRAYAKQLSKAGIGRYGFAPLSLSNTGGWHLTAMMYSFGGQPEIVQGGKTLANVNSAACVKPLQLLWDMRWRDHSIGPKEMGYNDNTAALANGSIAMGILAGDQPRFFKTQYQADINNFMLAGLPQGGGNATLMGGDVQLVKPGSSSAVINAALEFAEYRYWDLTSWAASDKGQLSSGGVVGIPANIVIGGSLKAAIAAIDARYTNVPAANYKLFADSCNTLKLTPEPRVQAQKLYSLLDPCVQAVLSSQSSNPQALLDDANKKFQAVLDAANG
ncbi:MAG TPA: extracellular solute-binding protein [Chloroflexota bacterium]|jgi:ABC-type glycerol-3-phosphate transport system substrate-binding protein